MQTLAQEMSRVAIGELIKRTEHFVARAKVELGILKGERVKEDAMTVPRNGLSFSARKQASGKAFTS